MKLIGHSVISIPKIFLKTYYNNTVKKSKTKRILKASGKNKTVIYPGMPIRPSVAFSAETLRVRVSCGGEGGLREGGSKSEVRGQKPRLELHHHLLKSSRGDDHRLPSECFPFREGFSFPALLSCNSQKLHLLKVYNVMI